jgi:hypothetical protein
VLINVLSTLLSQHRYLREFRRQLRARRDQHQHILRLRQSNGRVQL